MTAIYCGGPEKEPARKTGQKKLKETLIKANKEAVKTEEQHIQDFLERYKWDMEETGTGLRYMVYEKGMGAKADLGDIVTLHYSVYSITGDLIYTSDSTGPLVFEVGKGDVITGLEEGILLLRIGDKAKFIIPSHLAYGLIGDQDKIQGKSTLVYDLEFIGKE